ncbi:MAG TPA: ABC transporter substrate-binding protein [Solirubrobacteraceae bacterium]|jgi:peptide/nickel transport system substrate-binding protein|nr:ABC transporter substrate-binding protein [Solirubrobacteraceae bacterium]
MMGHRQVHRTIQASIGTLLTFMLVVGVSACGSSSTSSGKGPISVLMGTAPDSLDPGLGATTQSYEATWITYTGLVTYAHASGEAGTKLIPGVAQSLPTVTNGGKTYTFMLRKGLVYSNGAPVKASDFAYAIERAIKLGWGSESFLTENIAGAEEFQKGKAASISGIQTDDATGRITIQLVAPYGPFLNVLAFPAAGLVPSGTPMKSLGNDPPPGVGPYEIESVVPNKSFAMVLNPNWSKDAIPGIPAGHENIDVSIVSNNQSQAEQVLNNSADVFDYNDTIPPTLISQIESQASDRFAKEPTVSGLYFFLNTKEAPFNNARARQAVNYGLNRQALQRLDSGMLQPACFFLPVGMPGHPTNAPCPYGEPNAQPDLAKAKELVRQAGLEGAPVTVWGGSRAPHKEFIDYYTSMLNEIGFKATEKIVADAQYYATVGNLSNKAQTGFLSYSQDFPNPLDFYQLLDAQSILPTENHNLSQVNDPHIQSELASLGPIPSSQLSSVVPRWQALDEYTAKQAYLAVSGYEEVPKFFSDRINFGAAIFHPVYGNDWSSLELK